MNSYIERRLAVIEDDTEKGASQLASLGIELLKEACISLSSGEKQPEEIIGELIVLAGRIDKARPSMACLGNWAALFVHRLKDKSSSAPENICREVANEVLQEKASILSKQVEFAKSILSPVSGIITLSHSSTVEKIIIGAAPENLSVTVAESRPLMEGRRLCEKLLGASFHVRLITDAQIGLEMKNCDMAITGADTILSDMGVINKTGSLLMALAARREDKPFIVAADTSKIHSVFTCLNAPLEEKPGDEVWEKKAAICSNVYFEPVPADLISGYLTEKGLLSGEEMSLETEKWRVLRDKIYKK